jgi:hypothetical protein
LAKDWVVGVKKSRNSDLSIKMGVSSWIGDRQAVKSDHRLWTKELVSLWRRTDSESIVASGFASKVGKFPSFEAKPLRHDRLRSLRAALLI